jgi:hypothetical protein
MLALHLEDLGCCFLIYFTEHQKELFSHGHFKNSNYWNSYHLVSSRYFEKSPASTRVIREAALLYLLESNYTFYQHNYFKNIGDVFFFTKIHCFNSTLPPAVYNTEVFKENAKNFIEFLGNVTRNNNQYRYIYYTQSCLFEKYFESFDRFSNAQLFCVDSYVIDATLRIFNNNLHNDIHFAIYEDIWDVDRKDLKNCIEILGNNNFTSNHEGFINEKDCKFCLGYNMSYTEIKVLLGKYTNNSDFYSTATTYFNEYKNQQDILFFEKLEKRGKLPHLNLVYFGKFFL